MKTVQEIYSEYKIMPMLQLHQLRVAAVSKIICENFKDSIDEKSIILACLSHDMGNIIKSDLNYFPESLEPYGLEYWQKIKDEYIKKYGLEEHLATELIVKEIGLSSQVVSYIKNIGFSNCAENEMDDSFENKICNYSDMRVAPFGVTSIEERALDGRKRYLSRKKHTIVSDNFEPLFKSLKNIEKQIFAKTNIKPEDIKEENIQSIIEELRNIKIN